MPNKRSESGLESGILSNGSFELHGESAMTMALMPIKSSTLVVDYHYTESQWYVTVVE